MKAQRRTHTQLARHVVLVALAGYGLTFCWSEFASQSSMKASPTESFPSGKRTAAAMAAADAAPMTRISGQSTFQLSGILPTGATANAEPCPLSPVELVSANDFEVAIPVNRAVALAEMHSAARSESGICEPVAAFRLAAGRQTIPSIATVKFRQADQHLLHDERPVPPVPPELDVVADLLKDGVDVDLEIAPPKYVSSDERSHVVPHPSSLDKEDQLNGESSTVEKTAPSMPPNPMAMPPEPRDWLPRFPELPPSPTVPREPIARVDVRSVENLEEAPLSVAAITGPDELFSRDSEAAGHQENEYGPDVVRDMERDDRSAVEPREVASPQYEARFDRRGDLEVDAPLRVLPRADTEETPRDEVTGLLVERARARVEHGYDLGRRGAVYSAKNEFVSALQLLAQGLDASKRTRLHTDALNHALRALEESNDFAGGTAGLVNPPIEVARIVSTHATPVFKGHELGQVSAFDALQAYYQYAKEQLVVASGRVAVASTAVQGLARVETALFRNDPLAGSHGGPKAISLYQSAVLIDPQNHKAANELGVLLASFGQLEQAKRALVNSVSVHPDPVAFHNLSVVYEKLGEIELGQQARQQSESIAQELRSRGDVQQPSQIDHDVTIRWVDVNTFADPGETNAQIAVQAEPRSVRASASDGKTGGSVAEAKSASKWPTLPNIFSVFGGGNKTDPPTRQARSTSKARW